MYGTYRSANDTTTDVNTITTRYADVAIEFSMPAYVAGGSAAAREPCWRVYVRRARCAHHELCASQLNPAVRGTVARERGTHVEVERHADDGQEPQHLVHPADVAAEPVGVLVRERLEEEVEEVDRRERECVQQEGLEHVRAHLRVAAGGVCSMLGVAARTAGRAHLDMRRTTASQRKASSRPRPAACSCSRAVSCGVRNVG